MPKPGTFPPFSSETMPNKSKSRNNSRKSTASTKSQERQERQEKLVVDTEDDWSSLNIVMKTKPPSSKKTTPSTKSTNSVESPRPSFLEPLSPTPVSPPLPPPPPPSPWDILGMTEVDFIVMMDRVRAQQREYDRQIYIQNMLDDLNNPSYWQGRIDLLEREREFFNKKRGWSAADIVAVEHIDQQIAECESEIDRIHAEADRLEYEYD